MRFLALSALITVIGIANSQTIDPSTVPSATRAAWCRDQQSSCPLLCLQSTTTATTQSNTCDSKTLAWTCVCKSGLTPNISEYSLTIPYYECTEYGNQCVKACGQNGGCASDCRTQHPCGAQNPTRVNSTSSASGTASGSSASGTGDFSSFGGGSSGGGKSAGVRAYQLGQSYGLAIVGAGIFAGFALLL